MTAPPVRKSSQALPVTVPRAIDVTQIIDLENAESRNASITNIPSVTIAPFTAEPVSSELPPSFKNSSKTLRTPFTNRRPPGSFNDAGAKALEHISEIIPSSEVCLVSTNKVDIGQSDIPSLASESPSSGTETQQQTLTLIETLAIEIPTNADSKESQLCKPIKIPKGKSGASRRSSVTSVGPLPIVVTATPSPALNVAAAPSTSMSEPVSQVADGILDADTSVPAAQFSGLEQIVTNICVEVSPVSILCGNAIERAKNKRKQTLRVSKPQKKLAALESSAAAKPTEAEPESLASARENGDRVHSKAVASNVPQPLCQLAFVRQQGLASQGEVQAFSKATSSCGTQTTGADELQHKLDAERGKVSEATYKLACLKATVATDAFLVEQVGIIYVRRLNYFCFFRSALNMLERDRPARC
jgi:hypothetical protein